MRQRNGFAAQLRQGVLDTNAEALLPLDGASFGAVGPAFSEAKDWDVSDSTGGAEVSHLPADARRRILDEVRDGYIIVTPRDPTRSRGEEFAGWWRIDPRTGHTLGVDASGWGQSLVERVAIAIVATWAFEYMICRGAFTWGQRQEAYALPFPLSLATPLAAESREPCSVEALVQAFVAAGIEIGAVTWPIVKYMIAGKGYAGLFSGRPWIATGEPEPGDLPPIFNRPAAAPPRPDCPPGTSSGAGRPTNAGEPGAEGPPSRLAEGEGRPASGGEQPGTPPEPTRPYYAEDGSGLTPVPPENAQQRVRQASATRNQAEQEVDERSIEWKQAADEYKQALGPANQAKQRTDELHEQQPGSDEATDAYQDYLAKGREVDLKGNTLDQAQRNLSQAQRSADKARYSEWFQNRLATANSKAYEARQAKDEAAAAWRKSGATDYDSPEYMNFKNASDRYRQAQRELSDAYWGQEAPARGTDNTMPAATEPAAPPNPASPPSGGAPPNACGGGPPLTSCQVGRRLRSGRRWHWSQAMTSVPPPAGDPVPGSPAPIHRARTVRQPDGCECGGLRERARPRGRCPGARAVRSGFAA